MKGYYAEQLDRSVISASVIHIDSKPTGQDHLVCSLMPGVFNSWRRQPKYLFAYMFMFY